MKITTEKLPKSLIALDIELDKDQFEKGLDRAARRLSQKYNVPGFRKGKAPRFIIENYFGREVLVEEASDDLMNRAFKEALQQENITPVGQANLETLDTSEAFRFRVLVPVSPSITLPDYRAIRIPLEREPVTEEIIERAMDMLRDKHVLLKEMEDPRPAQDGDLLTIKQTVRIEGDEPEPDEDEDEEPHQTTVVLEQKRLIPEFYEGLLGVQVDEKREIIARLPDDHENEDIRGKNVTFIVEVSGIQERVLPEWEEIPALEEFEGTLEELRQQTAERLEKSMQDGAERHVFDKFVEQLVAQTEYDIADTMIDSVARDLLQNQGRQFLRYGVTLEQMLQYQGKTVEQATQELLPDAERQLQVSLAMMEIARQEQITVSDEEIEAEIETIVKSYGEQDHANIKHALLTQMRDDVIHTIRDRKLQALVIALATDTPPAPPAAEDQQPETASEEASGEPDVQDNGEVSA